MRNILNCSDSQCTLSLLSRRGGRSKATVAKDDSEEEDEEEEEEQEDEPTPKVLKVSHDPCWRGCMEEFNHLRAVFTLCLCFFFYQGRKKAAGRRR